MRSSLQYLNEPSDPGLTEDALHVVIPADAGLGLQLELVCPGGGQVPNLEISDKIMFPKAELLPNLVAGSR